MRAAVANGADAVYFGLGDFNARHRATTMDTLISIGIIAAIAIPNLLNAIDRGKQKRTMADMKALAVALDGAPGIWAAAGALGAGRRETAAGLAG